MTNATQDQLDSCLTAMQDALEADIKATGEDRLTLSWLGEVFRLRGNLLGLFDARTSAEDAITGIADKRERAKNPNWRAEFEERL